MDEYFDRSADRYLHFLYVGDDVVRKVLEVAFREVRLGCWAPDRNVLLDLVDSAGMGRLALEAGEISDYVMERLNGALTDMEATENAIAMRLRELVDLETRKAELQRRIERMRSLRGSP